MMLYKFKGINCHSIRMIEKGEIFLSNPAALNDPLDCTLLDTWISQLGCRLRSQFGSSNLAEQLFTDPITNEKDTVLNSVRKRLTRVGVFSLSERFDDPLMWAHYGDEHRGLCVGFDGEKLSQLIEDTTGFNREERLIDIRKVKYEKKPPYDELINKIVGRNHASGVDVHTVTTLFVDLLMKVMTTKSEHWEYENERRIVANLSKENDFRSEAFRVPLDCIKEVNVGFRVSSHDFEQVKAVLADSALEHVELNRMEFSPDRFSMLKVRSK